MAGRQSCKKLKNNVPFNFLDRGILCEDLHHVVILLVNVTLDLN
jgi:hypothetical protein